MEDVASICSEKQFMEGSPAGSSKNSARMAVVVNYRVVFMPPVIPAKAGI